MDWKEMEKCKCGRLEDSFEYRWNGELCNQCSKRRAIIFCIVPSILLILISIILAGIQYDYDIKKCSALNSNESSYDFNFRLETNAEYNQNCYFLKNHPLALGSYYILAIMLGTMCGIALGLLFFNIIKKPYIRT